MAGQGRCAASGWEAIEVDRLCIGGREAKLVARQGDQRAVLEFAETTNLIETAEAPERASTPDRAA